MLASKRFVKHSILRSRISRPSNVRLALVVATAIVSSAGCGGPRSEQSKTVVIALENDISGFNELVSADNSTTQQVIERLYVDLFEESPVSRQGPPEFRPRLAEEYERSNDGTTITARLRPQARWSDGTPITADDVRWTWQVQTDPAIAWEYVDIKKSIRDVEVVDERTVRFHFTHAYANQLADLNEGVVLPRHVWGQLPLEEWRGGEDWFRRHLVVSGPYQVEHYDPGAEVVLTANPTYYEPAEPELTRLVFQVIPDAGARLRGLLAGDLDFIPKLRPHEAAQVEASDNAVLVAYPHRQYDYIAWNIRDPLFADARVRKALTQAIDRQEIIDTLLAGYAEIATSPIVSSTWAHADLDPWPYDVDAAVATLADAGWQRSQQGTLRDAEGRQFAFDLSFNAANSFRRDAAAMIQQQLGDIGVEVTLRPEDFHVLTDVLQGYRHQAYLGAFNMDTTLDLTVILHSDSIIDGYNFSAFDSAEVDQLIEGVKTYPDILDAGDDLRRIQQILHQEVPMTFLWEPMRLDAHSTRLSNVVPNLIDTYANMRSWRLQRSSNPAAND